jgi:hypothetical protein
MGVCLLLIGILASCRFWCAASACEAHAAHSGPSDSAPHAVNDDDCLCNGGLRPETVPAVVPLPLSDPFLVPIPILGAPPDRPVLQVRLSLSSEAVLHRADPLANLLPIERL